MLYLPQCDRSDSYKTLELFILRHGEAGKPMTAPGRDYSRSLTEQGRKEVRRVAGSLPVLAVTLDHILSSPLSRAHETAQVVAETIRWKNEIELWDELKPEGEKKKLGARLSHLRRESSVLMVGHEPFLTSFIADVVGAQGARIVLKKAGLARVSVARFTPEVEGELRWLLSPRILKRIS